MNSNTNKFKENNAELAKALVEHKKTIGELKKESSKYRCAYFDVYNEKQLLKTQLTFAKKTVVDLFKANTQNYTDVMRKLGIALTSNNPSSKSISPSASPSASSSFVPIQRDSLNQVKRLVTEPIVPKKFATEVPAVKKDLIGSHKPKPTTSTSQPASDKEPFSQPNAGLPQREPMDRNFTATTPSKQGIDQYGKDQLHESIMSVPKIIITSYSDGEGEELNISHTLSKNSVKRSPVGIKMNYDEEANTSLRELKEKKLSEKLSPVPDESNRKRIVSPLIKSTAYNATKRSAQAYHIAQARLSDINKVKSPSNESKSPTNNIRNNKEAPQHQPAVESFAKFTSQQVDPGEGTSGKNSQPSSSGDPLKVRSNSTERSSSRNKEKYLNPLALLKRIQRQSLVSRTPKKFFSSPKENATPIITTVADSDLDRSPQVDVPIDLYRSHRGNSPISIPPLQAGHCERRETMAIEPNKESNQSVQQSKLNIETPFENKRKSIAHNNLLLIPSQKYINNLGKAKENEEVSTLKSTLQKSAHRSPLKTIQSPNISKVSNKLLERSSIIRNVIDGPKSPNGNADALRHQESTHGMERQSDDTIKRRVRLRTKSKENVSIDDERPNVNASNIRADERHKSRQSMEMQSDDSNKRRARSRTRSRDNILVDDEQPNFSERPRRHIATTNYAEPKLNTKMRRNF